MCGKFYLSSSRHLFIERDDIDQAKKTPLEDDFSKARFIEALYLKYFAHVCAILNYNAPNRDDRFILHIYAAIGTKSRLANN